MTSTVLTVLHDIWLLALPLLLGLLPGTLAVRRSRLPPWFWMPATLAAGAFAAYILFWVFFFWPKPAKPIALSVIILSVGGFLLQLESRELRAFLRQRDVWLPGVLTVLLAAAYLAYLAWPGTAVWDRFTISVPPGDNMVPMMVAERVYWGYYHLTTPPLLPQDYFFAQTRSSDRPPLLAAIVMALRPAQFTYSPWTYQIVGTMCQMGWVSVLYALGRTLMLTRRQLAFTIAATASSGFFLMHSLLTWPKLLGAWLFLFALALIVHAARHEEARTTQMAAAIGALLALSQLSHGGPFFSIVALPVFLLLIGAWRFVRPMQAAIVACTMVLLLAPWMAYQRFYDPPGNALVKLHLAGVTDDADTRGTLEAVVDAYRGVTWSAWLEGRWENVREQWLVFGKSGRSHPVDWGQWQQFFHHVPALDFLVFGYLAFAVRRWRASGDSESFRWLGHLTWYALAATLVWIVILFPAGTAMIHHGSYATTALLFFCAAAWAASLPRWIGTTLLALHVTLFILIWMPARTLQSPSVHPVWQPWNAVVMIAAFAAFVVALRIIRAGGVLSDRSPAGPAELMAPPSPEISR
jgi:hypothetical protein